MSALMGVLRYGGTHGQDVRGAVAAAARVFDTDVHEGIEVHQFLTVQDGGSQQFALTEAFLQITVEGSRWQQLENYLKWGWWGGGTHLLLTIFSFWGADFCAFFIIVTDFTGLSIKLRIYRQSCHGGQKKRELF